MAQVVKNPPANAGDSRDVGSSWVGKIPWSRKWQPLPVFLPSKFHGWEAWRTTVHGVTQSRTWLSTAPPPHTHMHIFLSMGSKSASSHPQRLLPTRLLCPCNFPDKNTGGGFPFPTPRNLSDPGVEPTPLEFHAMAGDYVTTEPPGKPLILSLYYR